MPGRLDRPANSRTVPGVWWFQTPNYPSYPPRPTMDGIQHWDPEPDRASLPYLPLETLTAAGQWACVITSEEIYRCCTHWIPPRTLPCLGDDCYACSTGRSKRREAFASVLVATPRKHILLRLTEHVATSILSHPVSAEGVRGVRFEIKRRRPEKHSFVQVIVDPTPHEGCRLPTPPILALHLQRVWRLDGFDPGLTLMPYAKQLKLMVEGLDEKKEGGSHAQAS